jgi:hypothetical protein
MIQKGAELHNIALFEQNKSYLLLYLLGLGPGFIPSSTGHGSAPVFKVFSEK